MYDVAAIAALESGDLVLRDFWTAHGQTLGGAPKSFGYWTGEDHVAVNVVPAGETNLVSRNYLGATLKDVPALVDQVGLGARSFTFGFDHLDTSPDSPMDMVFGHDVRVARVEMHRGLFDPATWNLVSAPHLMFAGRVDGAEVDDAAAGGEGGLEINAVIGAIDLTKVSHAMESDEHQRLRSGDRFRRYGDTAADVPYWWGQVKSDGSGSTGSKQKVWGR